MKWLSLDPGNSVGWALWENTDLIDSGVIRYQNHEKFCESFPNYLSGVLNLENIMHIAFEIPVVAGKFGDTVVKQGEKCGIIKAISIVNCINYTAVHPSETTNAVWGGGGRRQQRKQRTQNSILLLYGPKHARDNNQADAVAVGLAYLAKAEAA